MSAIFRTATVLAALGLLTGACADLTVATADYLDREAVLALDGVEGGDPFYEVTLLRYDDVESANAYDHDAFLPEGAEVVYSAPVERQLQGDTRWDLVEVVFWPDRHVYVQTMTGDDFATQAAHREAGVAEAHVALASPVTPITEEPLVAGEVEAPPLPADVPFPAEGADEPFVLVAAVAIADEAEYEDGRDTDLTGEEALDLHYEGAEQSSAGGDLGIRPVMWMDVDTTIAGDPDEIESIRFNWWPSHATFDALLGGGSDTAGGAGTEDGPDTSNRTAGLENASTMITVPEIDRFSSTERIGRAELSADEIDIEPLLTEPAVGFLVAADEFQSCLEATGWGWQGEPGNEGVPDDPDYVVALGGCQGDSDVAALLVAVFEQPDDVALLTEVDDRLLTDAAVESLAMIDRFIGCLDGAGFGWLGAPTEGVVAGDPGYQTALLGCITEYPVNTVLDALLTD